MSLRLLVRRQPQELPRVPQGRQDLPLARLALRVRQVQRVAQLPRVGELVLEAVVGQQRTLLART